MFLKQSTAYTFRMGPFLDETDGKTAETGLTISQADVRLSKGGGNFAQKNESTSASHDEIGYYIVLLDATDTATVGELLVAVHESGALPVFKTFQVVEEAIYDAIYGGSADLVTKVDAIDTVVDAVKVVTDAISTNGSGLSAIPWNSSWDAEVQSEVADGLAAYDSPTKAEMDSAHSTTDGLIGAVDTVVDAIKVVTDAISTNGSGLSAVPWNAAWDAEVQSECADALTAYDAPTKAELDSAFTEIKGGSWASTDTLEAIRDRGDAAWTTGGGGSAPSAAAIADAVWDEATSGHTSSGTFGEQVKTDIDAILLDTAEIGSAGAGLTAVPWNASWDAEVQSEVADALADYDPPTKAEMDAMWTTAATESYASDGAAATPAQLLYMILCAVSEFSISSTTITGKKVDGSTTAMTWTLDDASSPTSRTRAS